MPTTTHDLDLEPPSGAPGPEVAPEGPAEELGQLQSDAGNGAVADLFGSDTGDDFADLFPDLSDLGTDGTEVGGLPGLMDPDADDIPDNRDPWAEEGMAPVGDLDDLIDPWADDDVADADDVPENRDPWAEEGVLPGDDGIPENRDPWADDDLMPPGGDHDLPEVPEIIDPWAEDDIPPPGDLDLPESEPAPAPGGGGGGPGDRAPGDEPAPEVDPEPQEDREEVPVEDQEPAPEPGAEGDQEGGPGGEEPGGGASVELELAEHERWGAALAEVGGAGSAERAAYVAELAGTGVGEGAIRGGIGALVTGAIQYGGARALSQTRAVPFIGPILGLGLGLAGLYSNWQDRSQIGDTISSMGQGDTGYEIAANTIQGVITILDVLGNIASVVGGVAGIIAAVATVGLIPSFGATSPVAVTAGKLATVMLAAGLIITALKALLQPLVVLFRSLHTFTSEADPRAVQESGGPLAESALAMGTTLGSLAGAAVARGVDKAAPQPRNPVSTADGIPGQSRPSSNPEGPRVRWYRSSAADLAGKADEAGSLADRSVEVYEYFSSDGEEESSTMVDPDYARPPVLPERLAHLQLQIDELNLAASLARRDAAEDAEVEAEEQSRLDQIGEITEGVGQARGTNEDQRGAVSDVAGANQEQQERQEEAGETLADSGSELAGLGTLKVMLRGWQGAASGFASIFYAIGTVVDAANSAGDKCTQYSADAARCLEQMGEAENLVRSEAAAHPLAMGRLSEEEQALAAEEAQTEENDAQIDTAEEGLAEAEAVTTEGLALAQANRATAEGDAETVGGQAVELQAEHDRLAAALESWAATHQTDRRAAVAGTVADVQAGGGEVLEYSTW